MLGPGRPQRLLDFQRTNHRIPRAHLLERQLRVNSGQTDLVGEQPPDRDLLLTGRTKLRPVPDDRSIEIELTPLHEKVRAHGGGPFRSRGDSHDGIPFPGPLFRAVGQTTPQIDHRAPVHVHATGTAQVLPLFEVVAEGVGHQPPSTLNQAIDVTHMCTLQIRGCRAQPGKGGAPRV